MILSRTCECARPLKDGERCAKCGRAIPRTHRPRPPMLDRLPRKATDADYQRLLDRLAGRVDDE